MLTRSNCCMLCTQALYDRRMKNLGLTIGSLRHNSPTFEQSCLKFCEDFRTVTEDVLDVLPCDVKKMIMHYALRDFDACPSVQECQVPAKYCCVCFETSTPVYFKCDHSVCVGCASILYARGVSSRSFLVADRSSSVKYFPLRWRLHISGS
jgi:hypothetical protein